MKWLLRNTKLLLLLLLNVSFLHICKSESSAIYPMRNAVVKIDTFTHFATIRICRYSEEEPCARHVIRTNYPGRLDSFHMEENLIDYVYLRNGNISYTTIQIPTNGETITVSRLIRSPDAELIDCLALGDDVEWFGGPQLRYQHWPIQHMYYEEEPYLPTHPVNMAVAERYWLSSKGTYIYIKDTNPLFLDQNNHIDKHLCFVAKNKAPYTYTTIITLNYEIGVFSDPKIAHQYVVNNHFGKPNSHPNERMIRHPIWSTWARYKANVSEKVVEDFADEIIKNGFNNSQLEIDDNWETCYGSAEFDKSKFPNITQLVNKLKAKGFRVTLWIHPFINKGCEPAYSTALNNSYFVKSTTGEVKTSWWQGSDAAVIDFTNPKAVDWWIARLKRLQVAGIHSFKFDAGEVSWLPQVASLNGPSDVQPGIFTFDYVKTLVRNFDDSIEVRVGWETQSHSIFVRMIDKDTSWTWNNGLPTLITTLLQMNMNGYIFVLPDMIGGNGYLNGSLNGTVYPSKELFIRWLQANVFMPSLQYSFVPWDFDNETITICKAYTDLHAQVTPLILKNINASIERGVPLNPPIWWVDPANKVAHTINDEYLLGEDVLVAPIIVEGAESRDIYLPKGKWVDPYTADIYLGPGWIRNYDAPLYKLPYFYKN